MDDRTLKFYSENANEVFLRYKDINSGITGELSKIFKSGEIVLDIGSGSGRDILLLLKAGVDAYGLEPSAELSNRSMKEFPELKKRLFRGSIPNDIKEVKGKTFDGIICSAVLMHIPEEDIFDSVYSIRNLLKDKGKLVISIPTKRDDVDDMSRDHYGRLMVLRDPWSYKLLFERIGFKLRDYSINRDALNRSGIEWATMIFDFHSDKSQKPIDKIESILNKDKKNASYKLALFRALCDIARTEYRHVKWEGKGRVSVPLEFIAEKWIEYYWPFSSSPLFIPQKYGETQDSKRNIVFRKSLKSLTDNFKNSGEFPGFFENLKKGLNNHEQKLYKNTLIKIRQAIITGPIVYAGGSLQEGRVFSYNSRQKKIIFDADIWEEIVLMGHWINDSLILRWAELTSSFTGGVIEPSKIINLLIKKDDRRNVNEAKKIYDSLKSKECVWSGRSIKDKYDVDHAIPFSLWRNNNLWNLFPALSSVNSRKKDRLPSAELIKKRKDSIIYYWEKMRENLPDRFDNDIFKFANINETELRNWENILFARFKEAVEITALQRGWSRWGGV